MKKWMYVLSILGVCVLAGCQQQANTGELVGSITAVGSSALQPLVEVASEAFQEDNKDVFINVQGGGSGQGLSQIVAGTVEIGNSDVFAEDKKIDIAKYQLLDHKVAVVGMGPIVNKEANVTNVTRQQLKDIFLGKVRNWQEVGGADVPIIVINRAPGSGSRATFEKFALDGQDPVTAQEQDNTGTVRKLVKETKGAISYVSFSYFSDDYQALSIDGVEPIRANVETNAWQIWSYEHMYTSENKDSITDAFMTYILSKDVQEKLVPELGYIPITTMQVERDAAGHVKPVK